jgi:tryptophanyl-tRNA synthetase
MSSKKPVLVSGIKPTGNLHIGNYFGAIRQQVSLFQSGEYDCYIFVADYHALNFIQNREEMQKRINEVISGYIAAGLDPEKLTLFKQSDVPAHTELAWIFDTITTMPYLMRAHAFKDAEAKGNEVSVGTFNYPMLMAADILLYDADIVPVGQDQKQHIEYARDTAEKFNRIFGETFTLPKEHIVADVAIVPGTDGRKMSKSYGNVISLFASAEETEKQVMGIVTDSSGERPENVYALHKLVKSDEELISLYEEHKGQYKILKEILARDLNEYFAPMRKRYQEIQNNSLLVTEVLTRGKEKARQVSEVKMLAIREALGVA